MDQNVNSVVLLVGLAVGVDYSLFYLRREREERAAGRDGRAAIEAAAATSGHAVLVSGLTVVIAMAGMYLAGQATFTALATGAIIVVTVAMLASVTVLPALLSALGHRVEKGRLPFLGRRAGTARESRVWGAILTRVLRRPVVSLIAAVAVLIGLAIPALGMRTALPSLPRWPTAPSLQSTYHRMQRAFPGDANQATVVVRRATSRRPAGRLGDRPAAARGGGDRAALRAGVDPHQPGPHGRGRQHADGGRRDRCGVGAGAAGSARRCDPGQRARHAGVRPA